ncbi:MAG: FkbM family methyltransferase [Candidatus Poseidoniales archaeon]|nr:MAG: FkbM family methyltransferase [Candidatus Poseidoniales archaeon]
MYGLKTPGRIFNRFILFPILDRKIANSDLELFVHDKNRGLMRTLNYGERLNWTLDTGKVCDAVPWLDRIEPLLSKDDIVFDVGANMGIVANWFAQRCKHIHAFEPHPGNIATIKSQQELRNIDNITLHNIALGRTHSKMQLHVKQFHGHHSLGDVDNSPTIDKIEVDVNTIDEVAKNLGIKAINFLKIDVEGFESDVLHGAENLLKNKKIEYILFELQDSILQSINRTSSEVFEIIFNAGYQIIDLNGNMQKDNNKTIPNGDYLACLDGSETAKKLAGSEFDLI